MYEVFVDISSTSLLLTLQLPLVSLPNKQHGLPLFPQPYTPLSLNISCTVMVIMILEQRPQSWTMSSDMRLLLIFMNCILSLSWWMRCCCMVVHAINCPLDWRPWFKAFAGLPQVALVICCCLRKNYTLWIWIASLCTKSTSLTWPDLALKHRVTMMSLICKDADWKCRYPQGW